GAFPRLVAPLSPRPAAGTASLRPPGGVGAVETGRPRGKPPPPQPLRVRCPPPAAGSDPHRTRPRRKRFAPGAPIGASHPLPPGFPAWSAGAPLRPPLSPGGGPPEPPPVRLFPVPREELRGAGGV